MRKWIIVAAALLVVAAGSFAAWYAWSPDWAVKRMIAAAKSDDKATLAAGVDVPALKADMKADFGALFDARAREDTSPAAQMSLGIARSMLDQVVERLGSPDGLRATFAGLDDSDAPPGSKMKGKPQIERQGLSRFRLSRDISKGSGLVFERRGLSWKLTGIDLPPGGLPGSGKARAPTPWCPRRRPRCPAPRPDRGSGLRLGDVLVELLDRGDVAGAESVALAHLDVRRQVLGDDDRVALVDRKGLARARIMHQ